MSRLFLLFLMILFFNCNSPPEGIPRDPAPEPASRSERYVVAVYSGATCETIEEYKFRGNGFFASGQVVVTVKHGMAGPDFAVYDSSQNCFNGKLIEMHPWPRDLVFVRVRGHHGPGAKLADRRPSIGETAYQFSFEAGHPRYHPRNAKLPFSRRARQIVRSKYDTRYPAKFAARPLSRLGDSGSPLVNGRGEVIGLVQSLDYDSPIGDKYVLYHSARAIKKLLSDCQKCREILEDD